MDPRLHRSTAAVVAKRLSKETARSIFLLAKSLPKGILPTESIYTNADLGMSALDTFWGLIYSWREHLEIVLGELSVFPDLARRHKDFADTAPQHFQNFDISKPFPEVIDGVDSVGKLFEALQFHRLAMIDPKLSDELRAFSLAMFIHLVGDMLTPGHLMCRTTNSGEIDGGLNAYPIRIDDFGGIQLHGLFDGVCLICAFGFRPHTGPLSDWNELVLGKVDTIEQFLGAKGSPRTLVSLAARTFVVAKGIMDDGKIAEHSLIPLHFVSTEVAPFMLRQAALAGVVIADILESPNDTNEIWSFS
jgi:hypothetical protein